jgi:malate dehydrogenase
MSFIAIIGAGPTGGALAHKLATRDSVGEVRLIDDVEGVAAGKALDIAQSGPVEGFTTRVVATPGLPSAAGASAIVIADRADGQGEYVGESGLALLRKLSRLEARAPIVLAGAGQLELIPRAVSELHINPSRLLGSAPFALESALRAVAGLVLDASGVEISLKLAGVPPHAVVVGWEEATAFGQPLSSRMAPHEIAALSARIPRLWPPGPYALASAASRIVEAIVNGSRRRFSCFVALGRGRASAMPVELGEDGVLHIIEPTLTRQEQTRLDNALEANS